MKKSLIRAKISTYQMYVLLLGTGLVALLSALILASPDQLGVQTILSLTFRTLFLIVAIILLSLILMCLGCVFRLLGQLGDHAMTMLGKVHAYTGVGSFIILVLTVWAVHGDAAFWLLISAIGVLFLSFITLMYFDRKE